MTDFLIDGPEDARHTLVLAPGAGGGMRTALFDALARDASAAGIRVVRFEFRYAAAGRRRPDPAPVLLDEWRSVVKQLGGGERLMIGGKSMGGRMASMVADEVAACGLVCIGYPFHPPGQPEKLRTSHLKTLATRTLIVQGTRDPFGTRVEVESYGLSPRIHLEWIEGGDHSIRPQSHVRQVIDAVVRFITSS